MTNEVFKWAFRFVGCCMFINSVVGLVDGISRKDTVLIGITTAMLVCGFFMMIVIGSDFDEKENE